MLVVRKKKEKIGMYKKEEIRMKRKWWIDEKDGKERIEIELKWRDLEIE